MAELTLTVNGKERSVDVDPAKPLADVLRDDLGLKGTKQSCSSGVCGACTVRIDGEARKSCLHMAGRAEGKDIRTVEELSDGEELSPVQEAFMEEFSFQCGFCTPGFLNTTTAFLEDNPDPSEDEIKDAIHGNICRCTGYISILEGVKSAADKLENNAQTANDD